MHSNRFNALFHIIFCSIQIFKAFQFKAFIRNLFIKILFFAFICLKIYLICKMHIQQVIQLITQILQLFLRLHHLFISILSMKCFFHPM